MSKQMRGYIFSRPFMSERAPQHVQNIVIKNYCEANGIEFLLSATEHTMPGCYMILEQVLNELSSIDGAVFYSVFQLPESRQDRAEVMGRMMSSGKEIHFAVERMKTQSVSDFKKIEQLWLLRSAIES